MAVYIINPLDDPRWAELCEQDPRASVFHSTAWLEALHQTYGYVPSVYTTCPPAHPLTNGVVFCRISSWLTGRRMISLPFADHCEPLVERTEDREEICAELTRTLEREKLKYIEVRPVNTPMTVGTVREGARFSLHMLDLRPPLANIFQGLQKSSIQRKIRRAERDGLRYESGHSRLVDFYRMLVLTRRRHNLPPQPIEWFRNLITLFGDRLSIRVASHGEQPVAGILTISHRDTLVYKYGCSDVRYNQFGGMPFLMWKAIEEAKRRGLQVLDLGRSDLSNEGLIEFKNRLGACRSLLTYERVSADESKTGERRLADVAQRVFGFMPDFLSTLAGRLLYRHMA